MDVTPFFLNRWTEKAAFPCLNLEGPREQGQLRDPFWRTLVLKMRSFTGCSWKVPRSERELASSGPGISYCSFLQHRWTMRSDSSSEKPLDWSGKVSASLPFCVCACVWSRCLRCQQATNACENVQYSPAKREEYTQLSVASPPRCITLPQTGMSVLVSVHGSLHCMWGTAGFCLYYKVGHRQKSHKVIYGAE